MAKITAKYFSEKEFQRLTPPCSLQDMKQTTMDMVDAAREICGFPFIVTCAFRSVQWELDHGRPGTSSHTKGYALDIGCPLNDNVKRMAMIDAFRKVGFRRIGIDKNYIHVDNDPNKAQDVMWTYYK